MVKGKGLLLSKVPRTTAMTEELPLSQLGDLGEQPSFSGLQFPWLQHGAASLFHRAMAKINQINVRGSA